MTPCSWSYWSVHIVVYWAPLRKGSKTEFGDLSTYSLRAEFPGGPVDSAGAMPGQGVVPPGGPTSSLSRTAYGRLPRCKRPWRGSLFIRPLLLQHYGRGCGGGHHAGASAAGAREARRLREATRSRVWPGLLRKGSITQRRRRKPTATVAGSDNSRDHAMTWQQLQLL